MSPSSYLPISERFMANWAFEGPFARVKAQMTFQNPRSIEALAAIRTIMHRFIFLPGLSVLPGACFILGSTCRLMLCIRDQVQRLRKRLRFTVVHCNLLIRSASNFFRIRRFCRFLRTAKGSRRVVEQYRGHLLRIDRIVSVDRRSTRILTVIHKISACRT